MCMAGGAMMEAALRQGMRHVHKRLDSPTKTQNLAIRTYARLPLMQMSSIFALDARFSYRVVNHVRHVEESHWDNSDFDAGSVHSVLHSHRLRTYSDVHISHQHVLVAAMALSMQKTALVQTPMVSRVASRSQAARAAVPRRQVHSHCCNRLTKLTQLRTGEHRACALVTWASAPICQFFVHR